VTLGNREYKRLTLAAGVNGEVGKLDTQDLLSTFPRRRPPLTEAHQKIFVEEYILNRSGKGLLYGAIKLLESVQHRKVAGLKDRESILEIGAGSLNHVPYESGVRIYDCVEPFPELFENSPHLQKIRNLYTDIKEVPEATCYQRIISLAVLEHLVDLPTIVAYSGLLLSPHGVFQASVPSEGGFLWGLSWRMSTGIAYRLRTGLDYKTVMRHEHINTVSEILAVARYFFETIRTSRFPFPSLHLSLYTYLEATNPRLDRCRKFLGPRNGSDEPEDPSLTNSGE